MIPPANIPATYGFIAASPSPKLLLRTHAPDPLMVNPFR